MGPPWQFALNKTLPARPNLGFTICLAYFFSLGSRSLKGHLILTSPGQCSSECWSKLESCAAPPWGNLRFGFSCMESSSECALRTRYVQLLSGFVGTFGRCCWIGFNWSKCLVEPGYRVWSECLWRRSIPSLTVRACHGLSWDSPAGIWTFERRARGYGQMGIC